MPLTEDPFIVALRTAKNSDQVLQLLEPHIRHMVEQADPDMLEVFDAAYEDGAVHLVDEILNGPTETDALSGEQALGLRGQIATNIVAFLINVAASLTVARIETTHPEIWGWLTGSLAPPAIYETITDPVDILMAHSGLPTAEQLRVATAMRDSPEFMLALKSTKLP